MCLICWPAVPEVAENIVIFYISILLYLISACLNENVMGQKLDICAELRLKVAYLHNTGHGDRGKVGVKLKNNFQCKKSLKKAKLIHFVLLKD